MSGPPDELTLILVGDETSPVRRIRFPRKWIGQGVATAAILLLVLGAIAVDWVRLRMEAVDVDALRVETAGHARAVDALHEEVAELAAGVAEVRELERKVRVIADLPVAIAQTRTPEPTDGTAPAGPAGDEADEPPQVAAGEGEASPSAPAGVPASIPDEPEPEDAPRAAEAGPDRESASLPQRLDAIGARADAIALLLPVQKESLEQLVLGLEGKSKQLESTPSIWPTDGWITSSYGYRTSPFTGRRQFHRGIDIAADFGTAIIAPARGRVSFAGRKGAMGRTVVIEHGYGLRTTYGHMARISVKSGQVVERGEPIGVVGSTGRSTGPHLHYAVARAGRPVDPRDYVIE